MLSFKTMKIKRFGFAILLASLISGAIHQHALANYLDRLPAMVKPLVQGNAYDVTTQVDAICAANSLPAYDSNGALMAAVQGHSDYQASARSASHSRAGGSTPKNRTLIASYGNKAASYVSKNIASGIRRTPVKAVQIWQGDTLHLDSMFFPNDAQAGASLASDRQVTYIPLNVGYIVGQAGVGLSASNQAQATRIAPGTPTPASTNQPWRGFTVMPVITVTPQADGSIVHIVQPGEVLLNIALAYGVSLSDLYNLNGLTEKSVIYPNEKIKIKGPDPTSTPTATATATIAPTATRRPTRTPTLTPVETPTSPVISGSPDEVLQTVNNGIDPLLIAIFLLVVIGISLVAAGALLRKK